MAHHHIIRLPAVLTRIGLSRSTVYAAISRNDFLVPISRGARAVGGRDSNIVGCELGNDKAGSKVTEKAGRP